MRSTERVRREGIRRLGSKEAGFRYRTARGQPVSAADRARIDDLAIPPAWQDVRIHPSSRGKVQAIGRDADGRWQYRYHPRFVERRAQEKFARLPELGRGLPALRRRVRHDLARSGLPAERVAAGVVRILLGCSLRPGDQGYTEEHGSFGVTTLRSEHIVLHGATLDIEFPGKGGRVQHRRLTDPLLVTLVRSLRQHPGEPLFRREGTDGLVAVTGQDVNDYLGEVLGDGFTAKDLRTWAGTLVCACALAELGADDADSVRARARKVRRAITATAERLGNTPAVCRSAYVAPRVIDAFERGEVLACRIPDVNAVVERRATGPHPAERALVALLDAGD